MTGDHSGEHRTLHNADQFSDYARRTRRTWKRKSGREDLNLRPVAAATALLEPIEVVSASPGFEVALSAHSFESGGKRFTVNHCPRDSVASGFSFTGVMSPQSFIAILTGPYITATSFLTTQDVHVEH